MSKNSKAGGNRGANLEELIEAAQAFVGHITTPTLVRSCKRIVGHRRLVRAGNGVERVDFPALGTRRCRFQHIED